MTKRAEMAKKVVELARKLEDMVLRTAKHKGWTEGELSILRSSGRHIQNGYDHLSGLLEQESTK